MKASWWLTVPSAATARPAGSSAAANAVATRASSRVAWSCAAQARTSSFRSAMSLLSSAIWRETEMGSGDRWGSSGIGSLPRWASKAKAVARRAWAWGKRDMANSWRCDLERAGGGEQCRSAEGHVWLREVVRAAGGVLEGARAGGGLGWCGWLRARAAWMRAADG